MSELLDDNAITDALTKLDGWSREDDALVRTAELGSFPEAIVVVTRIAEIAESVNHHPDIDIRWRKLILRCSTHSAGGVTAADVSMAQEINGVIDSIGG